MAGASSDISPVGMPVPVLGATITLKLTGVPCGKLVVEFIENVVVVGLNVTLFQFDTRFETLIDPIPVAKS
jgi:hypothetical protein